MLEIIALVVIMFVGIGIMLFSSDKVVEYAQKFAVVFNFPPLIVGLVIVAIGTDLP